VASASSTSAAQPTTQPNSKSTTAAPKANQAAPEPKAVPTPAQLMPTGTPAGQSSITLSVDQVKNAEAIVAAGQQLNLPPRAYVIAVATSLQETKLNNYGDLGTTNDHDSLGLFQQRPSSGWGTPQEIVNPTYAATAFYQSLVQVPGWQSIPLTDAAQAVQVSAYGDRYAQWEQQAADLVQAAYGAGPYAALAAQAK
jgi:hypothetical protein